MPALTTDIHAYGGRTTHSHIPAQPLWVGILRIVQAVLALITLALSAYCISYFGGYSGYALNIFTSLLTWIFLGYIFITAFLFPLAYSVWAQLGFEIGLFIFWLSTWATIASLAAAFGDYRYYGRASTAVACTKAAAALGAFAWASFIATLVNLSLSLHRHRTAGLSTVPGGETTEHKMEPVVSAQPVEADPQQPYQQPYVQPYVQQQTV